MTDLTDRPAIAASSTVVPKGSFQTENGFLISNIPTGAKAVSSHGYDPGLQLPWSRKLSDNWTAAGQFALYWQRKWTVAILPASRRSYSTGSLQSRWMPLSSTPETLLGVGGRHLLHIGAAYKATQRQQVDVHVGIGLSSAAIDHFVGIGYSFRFQALRR